jgi:hypothetical protein
MDDLVPIGYQLIIVTFVSGFVSLATLSVRLWFRVRQRKDDVSDTFLIAAMVRLSQHFVVLYGFEECLPNSSYAP